MKKILGFAAIIFASIAFIPGVLAADAVYNQVYDATQADAKAGSYTNAVATQVDGSWQNVILTYNAMELKIVPGDETRPDGYTWVGLKVEAPNGVTPSESVNGTCTKGCKDSTPAVMQKVDSYYIEYFGIDFAKLQAAVQNGDSLKYEYKIEWDSTHTQTITLVIDPSKVSLYPKEGKEGQTALWDETIYNQEVAKVEAAKAKNELDDVPNTGSTLPIALMGLLTLVTGTGIYTLKTAYSRK